jgi:hypothetical protein
MQSSAKLALVAAAAVLLTAGAVSTQAAGGAEQAKQASAAAASPAAVTFLAGKRGDTFESFAAWRLRARPGLYLASLRATLFATPSDPNATSSEVICGIADLDTLGTPTTRIYVANSTTSGTLQPFSGPPAAVSGSATVRVTRDMTPGVVCYAGPATIDLYQPVAVTLTELGHRTYGKVVPHPITKRAVARAFSR